MTPSTGLPAHVAGATATEALGSAGLGKIFQLQMPTEAELHESSLRWIEQVGPTLLDRWPAEVMALSMPTKFVRVPVELIEPLFESQSWPRADIDAFAAELDALMGWDRHFIRLNSRSPKDAPWPFEVPVTCSGKEAVGIMASSERVMDDLAYFSHIPAHPAYVCLREFVPGIRAHSEYRCFVKGGDLIAVTHYDYHNPVREPQDGGRAIREQIERWFRDTLKPRLHLATVVFDVFLPWSGEPLLIELNPYGLSDPCWLGTYDAVETFDGFVAFSRPQGASVAAAERSEAGCAGKDALDEQNPLPPVSKEGE